MTEHLWGIGAECDGVTRSLENGLSCLRVATESAQGLVFVQGAQVARWQPAGRAPVLWTSARAVHRAGTPLRGGVPICFPWFGAHTTRAELPAHGFARIREWQYCGSEAVATGVRLSFALGADAETRAAFPHDFTATLRATFGVELVLELAVENAGGVPFSFEEALHTYLAVSDVRQVVITGLSGARVEDRITGVSQIESSDAVRFAGEIDRIYESDTSLTLDDPIAGRRIVVDKTGSASTVIWNPWIEKAHALADFGDDEWTAMACIETANVRARAVTLAPGETHRMLARLRA